MPTRGPVAATIAFVLLCCGACQGYFDDDPCEGVTCSGHGRCVSDGDASWCECAPGFHPEGLDCVADGPPADGDGDGDEDGDGDADGGVDADAETDAEEAVDQEDTAECIANEDCDDGVGCTADLCVESSCVNAPDDARCDDGIECTTDRCDVGAGCEHAPDDAMCVRSEDTCDPDFGCARVLFVDRACAPCSATCTPSEPCATIEEAFYEAGSTESDWGVIRVAEGDYVEVGLEWASLSKLAVVGGPGVSWSSTENQALRVKMSSQVVLRDLAMTGARMAIDCDDASICALERVALQDGADYGARVKGDSILSLHRCLVGRNAGAGLKVEDGALLELDNCLVVGNGGVGAEAGGVYLYDSRSQLDVAYTTIADNDGDGNAGAVRAAAGATTMLANVILWENVGGATDCESCSLCSRSLDGSVDPGFVVDSGRSAPDDYRITAGSPAVDAGDPVGAPLVDYFGEPRTDGAPDVGADELSP